MSKLMSRLGWAWRLVMTGLCFVLFGLGGLLLSVVWFNILLVLVWDTSRRR
ncbi:1-acyl-sn-glycerol-3-phosphate acyltransferase, partial [Escherichia coli]|nr:1-acyl-sn-glycerol-3-phosphate acyltransferase [Escherichia coli]MBB8771365.1 1-acyl-sn-glycerol-3-phosphate acyltransferase [Escherichia coli]